LEHPAIHVFISHLEEDVEVHPIWRTYYTTGVEQIMAKLKSFGYKELYMHSVRFSNYKLIIANLQSDFPRREFVVLNLCDGTETATDNYPGLSVVKELEKFNIAFTGSDSLFYHASTSKAYMKEKFIQNNVPTSPFVIISKETLEEDISKAAKLIGFPLILKHSISYCSIGISEKSVVFNESEAASVARQEVDGKEIFAEKFLAGREFTVFVSGDKEQGVITHPPVELSYESTLATHLKLQTFNERVMDQIESNEHDTTNESEAFKKISVTKEDEARAIEKIAKDAYLAVEGSGYGRVDIRSDQEEVNISNLYVLEVNANPMTQLNDTSTLYDIIRLAKESLEEVTHSMIRYALKRKEKRLQQLV